MSRYTRLLNRFMFNRTATLKAFAATLTLGLMVGCSAKNPSYHDYTLVEAPALPEEKVKVDLPETLGVYPVNVAGWLDKKNITWSDDDVRLKTSVNDHWGEPLPELLTQAMVQNLRRQVDARSWVSSGPWGRDKRPEVVAFADVHSITVVNHQLRVNVAWSMEGQDRKVIAQRKKVYTLLLDTSPDGADFTQAYVQILSRVWGLVSKDMIQALPAALTKS